MICASLPRSIIFVVDSVKQYNDSHLSCDMVAGTEDLRYKKMTKFNHYGERLDKYSILPPLTVIVIFFKNSLVLLEVDLSVSPESKELLYGLKLLL